jgi:murein DD-endopeptidase
VAARRAFVAAAAFLLVGAVSGCVAPRRTVRRVQVHPVPATAILKLAKSQLGRNYAYGGSDPSTGFDCSGLVWWCYSKFGSILPRTAKGMFAVGTPVERRDLRAGDLVFFDTASGRDRPSHVGIMVNHERFIHSPASGENVCEDGLSNNYWKRAYYGARRIE